MASVEKAAMPAAVAAGAPGALLLGTAVAGSIRGPLGQGLLLAEPRYASAVFAPPHDEAFGPGMGDITTWYPGGGAASKAAMLRRAALALKAQTPPATPHFSPPATPTFTPKSAPTYSRKETGPQGRRSLLPTLLPPPPEHRPGELCVKRGIRPPPGLFDLAEKEEAPIRPPPGLSLAPGADGLDDPKGDVDTCSTTASSRTASASLIIGLADSP